MALKSFHLGLILLGQFKFKMVRSLLHQGLILADNLPYATAQESRYFIYVPRVLFPGHTAYTAALTTSDMHLKTRTELMTQNRIGGDTVFACTQRISRMEEFHKRLGVHHRTVRPEISGAIVEHASGKEHARKLFRSDTDPRIRLGIFKKDVVTRLVLLDKIILKQQGVRLAVNDGILNVGNPGDQNTGLGIESLRRYEILGNPLVEVLRLAYINYIPRCVIIPIYARGMR